MPTLRRSKSLNDKAARQKNRVSDVIRDPRCPDIGGGQTRTRACLDNYQLLVHLKKQNDDKSRQLELASAYGNSHTFLRATAGAHRISQGGRPWSEFHPLSSASAEAKEGGPIFQSDQLGSSNRAYSKQQSCPGQDPGSILKHQKSFSEEHQDGSDKQQQAGESCQRPVSMFEPRGLGPGPEAIWRYGKDQTIQNLLQSQRLVNRHNQRLLTKVEELESENARLKAILDTQGIQHNSAALLPQSQHSRDVSPDDLSGSEDFRTLSGKVPDDSTAALRPVHGAGVPPLSPKDFAHRPASEAFPKMVSTLKSPISETSVSGYGSLPGSACDEVYTTTLEGRKGRKPLTPAAEGGGYNDDTLPLSEVSVERLSSDVSTLPSSLSSGGDSPTMDQNSVIKGDLESLHKKVDQLVELEMYRGSDRKKRIADLERLVSELREERKAVLDRYKCSVEQNEQLQRREERVQEDLRILLNQHGQSMETALHSGLQDLHQELQTLGTDVRGQLEIALASLATSSSTSSSLSSPSTSSGQMAQQERAAEVVLMIDNVVDLIGPEYLSLGRRLNVPQLQLEKIEAGAEDLALKTRRVLSSWMQQRAGEVGSSSAASPAQVLTQALRDLDKDVRLFNDSPISTPEREALRNCLQSAIDHVTNPGDLLDHMIILNELTPAGLTFVQEVLGDHPERALTRLWHVSEYRSSGILSRLGLALERCGHPYLSQLLTKELEIQMSQFYSHRYNPLSQEEDDCSNAPVLAAQSLASGSSPFHNGRSKTKSGNSRSGQEATAEGLPIRPKLENSLSVPLQYQEEIVWSRRAPKGVPVDDSPRHLLLGQGSRVSRV